MKQAKWLSLEMKKAGSRQLEDNKKGASQTIHKCSGF